jgi:hypothetical protein
MPRWDPRRKDYKARASAHKWLLVTCFGYLGYKNARFGRIEAHEAVTAYGREALLRAKEAAEDLGFTVLHMYVDGLWVRRDGANKVEDFQPLLEDIIEETGLPIAMDGIYRWIAFLPSRVDERVPVANRYFGVFQDGSHKVRGIELRRDDTPAFIAEIQQAMLERMAELPGAVDVARYRRLALRAAYALLQPLGMDEDTLENWVTRNAGYLAPPGVLPPRWARRSPLWAHPLLSDGQVWRGMSLFGYARYRGNAAIFPGQRRAVRSPATPPEVPAILPINVNPPSYQWRE